MCFQGKIWALSIIWAKRQDPPRIPFILTRWLGMNCLIWISCSCLSFPGCTCPTVIHRDGGVTIVEEYINSGLQVLWKNISTTCSADETVNAHFLLWVFFLNFFFFRERIPWTLVRHQWKEWQIFRHCSAVK